MWRVYAPLRDGVRIRSTVNALLESISDANMRYRASVSPIYYMEDAKLAQWGAGIIGHLEKEKPNPDELKDARRAIRYAQLGSVLVRNPELSDEEWKKSLDLIGDNEFMNAMEAIGPYQVKRLAFEWEQEVRLLAWSPERIGSDTLPYPFDPIKNIHEVLFDPRMDETICALVKEHVERLGLNSPVYQSRLYSLDL